MHWDNFQQFPPQCEPRPECFMENRGTISYKDLGTSSPLKNLAGNLHKSEPYERLVRGGDETLESA